jgi:hypothetical protein
MNNERWGFAFVAGCLLFTLMLGIFSYRPEDEASKNEKLTKWRLWDISNNDEAYWKDWEAQRNYYADSILKSGMYSIGNDPRPLFPTSAEEYLKEFDSPDRNRMLLIERLGIKEFEKVNAHFLEEFPIVSLQDRLKYEDEKDKLIAHSRRHGYDLNKAFVLLHDERNAYLYDDGGRPTSDYERPLEHGEVLRRGLRHQALEMLHRDGVRAFVNTQSFGWDRVQEMSILDLMTYDRDAVELPEDESKQLEGWYSLNDYGEDIGPGVNFVIANLRENYPKYMHLAFYHQFTEDRWYAPRFRQAAGFEPHSVYDSLNWRHDLYQPPKEPQWQVQRMELVSLLKHEEPAVYVSKTLPNMKQLVDGKTRPLDAFESGALQELYAGEFIVTEPAGTHLRMVGAVRAGETCIECHAVQTGELLGAFSYELSKGGPIKKSTAAVDY